VPNQPATPHRTIRVPDELWETVQQVAAERGETVTDVVLRALTRYARTYGHSNNGE
jgi:predicted transcriptional regulator